jgi:hypothetical protein
MGVSDHMLDRLNGPSVMLQIVSLSPEEMRTNKAGGNENKQDRFTLGSMSRQATKQRRARVGVTTGGRGSGAGRVRKHREHWAGAAADRVVSREFLS